MFNRIACVDLETSGLSPTHDRITEIGIVLVNGSTVEEWSSLIHPGRDVLERRRLCSRRPDELSDAPKFEEIASFAGSLVNLDIRLFDKLRPTRLVFLDELDEVCP
jgi:hypothetical protein